MPGVPTVKQRKIFKRTPSARHKAFLRTVPLMGEETLTTIEVIAVEECPALIQPEKQLVCPGLRGSDFLFPKRKPSRTAIAGK